MRKKQVTMGGATARSRDEGFVSIREIKLVAKLSLEHPVQACTYAYVWTLGRHPGQQGDVSPLPHTILLNICGGKACEMTPSGRAESLRSVVEEVLRRC